MPYPLRHGSGHVPRPGLEDLQGQEVTDAEALAQMEIPDYETVVEVPKAAITALLEEPRGADVQRRAQPAL